MLHRPAQRVRIGDLGHRFVDRALPEGFAVEAPDFFQMCVVLLAPLGLLRHAAALQHFLPRLRERLQDGPGPRMVLLEVLLVAGAGDA